MVSKKTTKRKTVWRSLPIAATSAESAAAGGENGAPTGHIKSRQAEAKPGRSAVGGDGDNLELGDAESAGDPVNVTPGIGRVRAGSSGTSSAYHQQQHHPHHVHQRSTTQYEGRSKPYTSFHRRHTNSSSSYNDLSTRPTQHPRRSSVTSCAANETTPEAAIGQELTNSEHNSYTSPATTTRWNNKESCTAGNRDSNYTRTDRYAPHRSTGSYSGSSYRRRPFSSNSRYYSGNTRSTFRIHRTAELGEEGAAADGKENDTKPLFNEDDYTRITTPRQDVLFKKGYLSRPKPHAVPVETTEPAPAEDVPVITIEEAIAAGLVHGYDPENPFLGFYDATGVFYVNPYLNGVEPFNGSMVMAPYGSEPYSINPIECHLQQEDPNTPIAEITAVPEELENKENLPLAEPTISIVSEPELEEKSPESIETPEENIQVPSPESDEMVSNDDSPSDSTTKGDDGDGEETTPEATIDGSNSDVPTLPGFLPQYLYPFVYGAPAFIPPSYLTGQSLGNSYESYGKFNRFKKRKRRPFRCPNSNELSNTTTDYSEDDEYLDPNQIHQELSFIPNGAMIQYNGFENQTALNTEVPDIVSNEFAPEDHIILPTTPPPSPSPLALETTTLNAEVAEFHPRSYTSHKSLHLNDVDTAGQDTEDSGISTSDAHQHSSSESSSSTPDPIKASIAPAKTPKTILDASDPPLAPITHNHTNMNLQSAHKNSQQISDIRSDPSGSHSDKHSTEVSACLSYAAMAQRKPTALPVKSDLAAKDVIVMPPKQQTGNNLGAQADRRNSANTQTNRNNTNSVVSKNISHSKPTKKSSPSKKKRNTVQNVTKSSAVDAPVVGGDSSDHAPAVEPPKTVAPELQKPAMPSFAQLLRPVADKEVTVKEALVEVKLNVVEENPKEQVTKSVEISQDVVENAQIKAAIAASIGAPTYQTIKVKGKKRTVQHVEPADFWEEKEDPIVVEVKPVTVPKQVDAVVITPTLTEEEPIEETATTQTKAKKSKSKRSSKKSASKDNRKTKASVQVEDKLELPTEVEIDNIHEIEPSAEQLDDTEQLDIEEYNFVEDPQAIFVNAIAQANIFSSPRSDKHLLSQSGSAGFGGMFATPTFGAKSPMGNMMLRQEEDMVMRIMRSLSSVEPRSPTEDVVKELIADEVLATPLAEDKEVGEQIDENLSSSQGNQIDKVEEPLINDEKIQDSVEQTENKDNEADVDHTPEVVIEQNETVAFLAEDTSVEDYNTSVEANNQITVHVLPEVELNSENTVSFDPKFDEVEENQQEGTSEVNENVEVSDLKKDTNNDDQTHLNGELNNPMDTTSTPSDESVVLNQNNVEQIQDITQKNTNGLQGKNDSIHDIDATNTFCNEKTKISTPHINGSNGHIENTNGFSNGSHVPNVQTNGLILNGKHNGHGGHMENHPPEEVICPSNDLEYLTFHTKTIPTCNPIEAFTNQINKKSNSVFDEDVSLSTDADEIVETICTAKLIITSETVQLKNGCEQNGSDVGERKTNGIEEIVEVVNLTNGLEKVVVEDTIENYVDRDIDTSSSLDQSETDGCSELSSMDTDDDDRTVVGPLDEYIEDVMIDGRDSRNILNCGEFYEGDDLILDPIHDGDIDELIKQAEQIVRLSTGQEPWSQAVNHSDSTDMYKDQDRNESPRSSEDSGILENHDEPITSATESESGQSDQYLKFPLTDAVSRWLSEKSKEKSPEPIIRIPEDPILSGKIEKSIQRFQISEMLKSYADDEYDDDVDEDDYTADESETEFADESAAKPAEPSKNLQSNPLLALSAEQPPTDNTDTSKRVAPLENNPIPDILMNTNAPLPSSPNEATRISALDDPDILEYWENDPMLQPPPSKGRRVINYARLLAKVGTKTTLDFVLNNNANCTKYPTSTTAASSHMTKASSAGALNQCASLSSKEGNPQLSDSNSKQSPEFGCVVM